MLPVPRQARARRRRDATPASWTSEILCSCMQEVQLGLTQGLTMQCSVQNTKTSSLRCLAPTHIGQVWRAGSQSARHDAMLHDFRDPISWGSNPVNRPVGPELADQGFQETTTTNNPTSKTCHRNQVSHKLTQQIRFSCFSALPSG